MNGADELNDVVGVDVTDDAGPVRNDLKDDVASDVACGMKVDAMDITAGDGAHGDVGTGLEAGTGVEVGISLEVSTGVEVSTQAGCWICTEYRRKYCS